MLKIFERSFIPIFLVVALMTGIAFGSLAPMVFLLAPLIALPILIYSYQWLKKYRFKMFEAHMPPQYADGAGLSENVIAMHPGKAVQSFREINDDEGLTSAKTPAQEHQEQIENITAILAPQITDFMPSDGSVVQHFTPLAHGQWIYRFHFKSAMAEFNAVGIGAEPIEAFSVAKQILQKQTREWHAARELDLPYVGTSNGDLIQNSTPQISLKTVAHKHTPTVLIIEDDMDIAAAMESIFKQLGCKTIVSDGHDGASHKMSFQNVDFVVLDWILGENTYADQLVKKSARIIDSFDDLKTRFKDHNVKVITYSALDHSKVKLPENQYFEHLDHWQKPVRYDELAARASDLLIANGF